MKTTLLTFASAALLSSAVFAGGGSQTAEHHMSHGDSKQQPTQQQSFNQHDKDQDGKISEEEAASNMQLTKRWVEIDANKDGSVDVTEFSRFEPTSMDQDGGSDNQQSADDSTMPHDNSPGAGAVDNGSQDD